MDNERIIAEVNGVPVLVERGDGTYDAPEGLEGVVAYLEAEGGVRDALEYYRTHSRQGEYDGR